MPDIASLLAGDDPLGFIARITAAVLIAIAVTHAGALAYPFAMRRLWGFMTDRFGPNRVGPQGLLQPIADFIKLLTKEDIVPAKADKWLHLAAPAIAMISPFIAVIVIPFSYDFILWDLNVGLLFIVAAGTFTVFGILLAGWASNNKYSLLGGLRGAAQMISYEIPLIFTLLIVALMAGSLKFSAVVEAQSPLWFGAVAPLAFLIYLIASTAETNKPPFDLPEAEGELVAGYITEYGAIRFALFFGLIEWGNVVVFSLIGSALFLGGPAGPFLPGPVWLILKSMLFGLLMIWFFATFPRLQIDQLMAFAWKVLIPITLLLLGVTATVILAFPTNWVWVLTAINWVGFLLFMGAFPKVLRWRLSARRRVVREPLLVPGASARATEAL